MTGITMYNTRSVQVNRFILQETGTYNQQFNRPYKTHIDPSNMQDLMNRVDDANHQVSGSLFAGIANNILVPSAIPMGDVHIPGGWGERRIRFLLDVTVTIRGSALRYIFQGFTSHLGVNPATSSIDPEMVFYINSFMAVTRTFVPTAMGSMPVDRITETQHVINGQFIPSVNNEHTYSMRPTDVFAGVQSGYIDSAFSHYFEKGNVYDARLHFDGKVISNRRSNNMPNNYISSLLEAYRVGNNLNGFGYDDKDIYSRSADVAYEKNIEENPFIKEIANIRGFRNVSNFSLNDLCVLDPNAPRVVNVVILSPQVRQQVHQAGQTSFWHGADNDTLTATLISNAVPSIMMELLISNISFRSTNQELGGRMITAISYGESITNIEMQEHYEIFKSRFEREVMLDITFNNAIPYTLEITADLFGDIFINLSLDGGPMTPFVNAAFCDSLTTPVVTTSRDNFYETVYDFESMFKEIGAVANAPVDQPMQHILV